MECGPRETRKTALQASFIVRGDFVRIQKHVAKKPAMLEIASKTIGGWSSPPNLLKNRPLPIDFSLGASNKRGSKMLKKCPVCEKYFESKKTEQLYCSRQCVNKAFSLGMQRRKKESVCLNCNQKFMPKVRVRDKYCSRECYFNFIKKKAQIKRLAVILTGIIKKNIRYPRICKGCGETFFVKDQKSERFYCTQECKRIALDKPYSTKHVCPECGEEFIGHKSARYCSKSCSRRAYKRNRKHIYRSGTIRHSTPITIFLLGKRDNWRCGICGKKIDPNAAHNDIENGATIDHILPLSRGGKHTWSNVQIAHFNCNSKRGNKSIIKQLYLDLEVA